MALSKEEILDAIAEMSVIDIVDLIEAMEEKLREWVKSNDPKVRDRMMRNAELVADRGLDAVLCLVARGGWETTAIKILSRIDPGNRSRLLRAIHDAEIQYARTSRYWK